MDKPEWLTIKPASTEKYSIIKGRIKELGLHTVCVEAHCPNMSECWSSGTATFMVLGDVCTRGCHFCAVSKNQNGINIDQLEPVKLAQLVKEWNLGYIVVTSVCRDDLPDKGASHFARCIESIKKENTGTIVEVLIPDFDGDIAALKKITDAKPDVIGHNIETVSRLSPKVRDRRATYEQSLTVLKNVKTLDKSIYTKSAMMLGIGETVEEITQAMADLRNSGVDFLAIGQYLRPVSNGFFTEVKEYVTPKTFEHLKNVAESMGFLYVASGPFVRSSYKAGEFFIKSRIEARNSPIKVP